MKHFQYTYSLIPQVNYTYSRVLCQSVESEDPRDQIQTDDKKPYKRPITRDGKRYSIYFHASFQSGLTDQLRPDVLTHLLTEDMRLPSIKTAISRSSTVATKLNSANKRTLISVHLFFTRFCTSGAS